MTSFGYWADRVPHGQFMCCLCFESKPLAQSWRDADGQGWDVCTDCRAFERATEEAAAAGADRQGDDQ